MATDFKLTQPVEYYRKYLEQDVRPDGRDLSEIRPVTVNIGSITTADGSALVKLGNTAVICGIKGELAPPKAETPDRGFIVPNVELPPLCSGRFRPGPPSEQAQLSSHFLDTVIKCSGCVKPEDLCIEKGKLTWVLYCDLMCLDCDGNLLDACLMALMAALHDVRLPSVTIDEGSGMPVCKPDTTTPLQIHALPVATTLAVFDGRIIFADPSQEEEDISTGTITIVTQADNKVCFIHKPGGNTLTESQLELCIGRAQHHAKGARRLIAEAVEPVQR